MNRTHVIVFYLLMQHTSITLAVEDLYFQPMDVFDLEYAADPRVAPDGKSIIYVRHSFDVMTDRNRSDIWQVDVDGRGHRPILSGAQNFNSPRWSPKGDRLAYLTRAGKQTELRVRWLASAQDGLLATVNDSPRSLTWSKQGDWIAFTMNVARQNKKLVKSRKKPEGAKWADDAIVIDTVRYQFDGQGIVEPEYSQVFIIPSDGGTPRQLTEGNFNHSGPLSWSPDDQHILFSGNRHEDWERETIESDIYRIDLASSTIHQLTSEPGAETSPAYSPDGKLIAYLKSPNEAKAYRHQRVAVMRADGTDARLLTADLDSSASDINWSDNSRSIYYLYDERAIRKVGRVSMNGEHNTVVTGVSGTSLARPYLSGSYDVKKDVVAFTSGSAQRPGDVATTRGVLTRLNEDLLAHKQLGEVREINYRSSHDGREIQGWYLTPPDFDPNRKYPLVLEIHGGPHSAYGAHFAAEHQLMATAGYVVFYDNYRGSTSYGADFALLLQYKYASREDFADHMSGVDEMIDKGFIDPDNLFVAGGSAGGIGTAYAIGLTNRFNAAVAAKPVINWISKTLTADSSVTQIRHQFPGMPWEEFEHYWRRSPLSLMSHVTTPTMLLTGEADRRTPISETEQFYQALKLKGVDAMMVRLPGASHGIALRPSRLITKVDYTLAWFERYRLKQDPAK